MPAFGRGDVPAARQYVASVLSGGGFGPSRRPPESWTDDYLLRQANRWRRDSISGVPLTKAAARGHAATPEHPREFTIRPVEGEGHRREAVASREAVAGDLIQREYRDPSAMLDWIARTPGYPENTVQITAYGVPKLAYSDIAAAAFRGASTEDRPASWLTVFTGLPGYQDFNDQRIGSTDATGRVTLSTRDLARAVDRVFEPRTVTRYTLRWHR